jgi:flavin reductase (DIM6/NTAB) family NADH-FMN oxidoreductase RutF
MISFDKPLNFEGAQFCDELEAAGVVINRDTSPLIDGNGVFWLDIASKDTQKAQDVLNAHIPQPVAEPTVADKLASVGLDFNELKAAILGGN